MLYYGPFVIRAPPDASPTVAGELVLAPCGPPARYKITMALSLGTVFEETGPTQTILSIGIAERLTEAAHPFFRTQPSYDTVTPPPASSIYSDLDTSMANTATRVVSGVFRVDETCSVVCGYGVPAGTGLTDGGYNMDVTIEVLRLA